MGARAQSDCRLHTGHSGDSIVLCRLGQVLSRRSTPSRPRLGQSALLVPSRQQCQAHGQALHAKPVLLSLVRVHDEASIESVLFLSQQSIATTVVRSSLFVPQRRDNLNGEKQLLQAGRYTPSKILSQDLDSRVGRKLVYRGDGYLIAELAEGSRQHLSTFFLFSGTDVVALLDKSDSLMQDLPN